jgi:hypothetical protein
MQKYLVASVYRDQGDEGTPTFCDPQIVWGVSAKAACKSGRYPNSTDKEGRLWGAPEALATVCPDGRLSYLTHYCYRLVDEAHSKAIDYTHEPEPSWDIQKFIDRILTEPAPRGPWLRNKLKFLGKSFVKTKFNQPDVTESIVADEGWLYCGEPLAVAPDQLKGVDWEDVTDEMVDKLFDQLINSFSAIESSKALHMLSSIKYDDTSLERQKAILDCMEKLLPDSVEAFTEGPVVNIPMAERLMLMKRRMLEHIANL